jgi:hypothetical protein
MLTVEAVLARFSQLVEAYARGERNNVNSAWLAGAG